jgi:hypothetical protein
VLADAHIEACWTSITVESYSVRTEHYYEELLRNWKKLCTAWTLLQEAEIIEMFITEGTRICSCCRVQASTCIVHLYTQLITTSNYSAIANSLHHTWSLLSLLYLHWLSPGNDFQCRSFLSYHVNVLTGRRLSHNTINSRFVLLLKPQQGPHREHHSQQFLYCCNM